MTGWRAIVPLKLDGGKSRLAGRLGPEQRRALVERMARHVVGALRSCRQVGELVVLSPDRATFPGVERLADRGRGLNAELAAALGGAQTLVIHGDLPLLNARDIAALIAAAEKAGAALAPDRAGGGTNALALRDAARFTPCFGPGSFARHRVLLPQGAIVSRPGLAFDLDTPDDLDLALATPGSCLSESRQGIGR